MQISVPIIGLVGGVASGKSLVARLLAAHGALVLDADSAGHRVLALPEVRSAAVARWGGAVLTPEGTLDRRAIADRVFAPGPEGARERAFWEGVTHPRIAQLIEQEIATLADQPGVAALVLDAPVLLEAGWDRLCDALVYVDAPHDLRLQRAQVRGWSTAELARREAAQMSQTDKRAACQWVVDNSGPPEQTAAHVAALWPHLVACKQPISK